MLMLDCLPGKQDPMDPAAMFGQVLRPNLATKLLGKLRSLKSHGPGNEYLHQAHSAINDNAIKVVKHLMSGCISQSCMPITHHCEIQPFQHMGRLKHDIKPENKHSLTYSLHPGSHTGLFQSLEANGGQIEPVDLSLNKRHSPRMSSSPSSPYSLTALSSTSPTMNIPRSSSPNKRSPQPPISMALTSPTVLATSHLLSRSTIPGSGLYPVIHPVVVQPVVYTQPIMVPTMLKDEMRNNQQGFHMQCAISGPRHLPRQQHPQFCNHSRGGVILLQLSYILLEDHIPLNHQILKGNVAYTDVTLRDVTKCIQRVHTSRHIGGHTQVRNPTSVLGKVARGSLPVRMS
ncbi:uncharacterized protein LOC127585664 isoform X3 [Pristis pectinata]|uniref:uncharacterized protein LOC127585664 isoform X3 n=1 Tax=Pristis pectinata TaxID=685728 RepID=UPI00223E66F7|nr:uncharacterized protein LOC127585664 isoform X3 [Pristis pectinata]